MYSLIYFYQFRSGERVQKLLLVGDGGYAYDLYLKILEEFLYKLYYFAFFDDIMSDFDTFEMFLFLTFSKSFKDSDPLITQELIDRINNNPRSSFKAGLNTKFAKMTIGVAKRFLSPIRPIQNNHASAVPVGANENFMHNVDRQYITGITNIRMPHKTYTKEDIDLVAGPGQFEANIQRDAYSRIQFPIYDVTKLCSSWASAVTSAMSISVSRWAYDFINFSLQYVLDCDILGDACIERTPLNAYQLFWERHPPSADTWDVPGDGNSERWYPTDAPRSDFTRANCADNSCYPGKTCAHHWALTGSCNPGDAETACPIYFLYNWRYIKSHLWEVGAVTSSIVVHPSLFSYQGGVYSSLGETELPGPDAEFPDTAIGMLDVTIIGWGQTVLNLSSYDDSYNYTKLRWWYVIPHFGEFISEPKGEPMFFYKSETNTYEDLIDGTYTFDASQLRGPVHIDIERSLIKFNRRFDDCNIESHAVGAAPYNFVPHPYRTPEPTWEDY